MERSLEKNAGALFREATGPLYGFGTEVWHTFGPFFIGGASAVSSLIGSDHDMSLGGDGRSADIHALRDNAEWRFGYSP
jgi:hypothetical protein